jgi:hypothetical protein
MLQDRPDGGRMVEGRRLVKRPLRGRQVGARPPVLQPDVEPVVEEGVHNGDGHGGAEDVGPNPSAVLEKHGAFRRDGSVTAWGARRDHVQDIAGPAISGGKRNDLIVSRGRHLVTSVPNRVLIPAARHIEAHSKGKRLLVATN